MCCVSNNLEVAMKKLMTGVAIVVLGLASIGCGSPAPSAKPADTKPADTKAEPAPTTTPDAGAPEKKE
jgi:hypothetical protein